MTPAEINLLAPDATRLLWRQWWSLLQEWEARAENYDRLSLQLERRGSDGLAKQIGARSRWCRARAERARSLMALLQARIDSFTNAC